MFFRRMIYVILALLIMLVVIFVLLQLNMPPKELEYPLHIGSGIVLEKIEEYNGVDFENRSCKSVHTVAAVIINVGSTYIESAQINLLSKDANYKFEICVLPPGMRILVLEANFARFLDSQIIDYSATVSFMDAPVTTSLLLKNNEVTNIGSNSIGVIYYSRLWDDELKLYCGGIACKDQIEYLPVQKKAKMDTIKFFAYQTDLIYIAETPVQNELLPVKWTVK